MLVTVIVIAVVVLLVLWIISVQRKFVSAEEIVKNAMSQIGVQQSSRWDALTALVELIKSYNEHEYKTLKDVLAARAGITANSTAEQAQAQEELLEKAMVQVKAISERYPELKADAMYIKTMDSVNTYENQVRMSRMVYNDSVTKYNRMVRQIPDSIVAAIFRFTEKDYLKENTAKSDMPSLKI
ncbi:MAG: LemA family protein [Bacteroidales bacterium]|nr:LemA family protein [Bacteroidales bacterium]